jgi:hypothetical protein
MKTARILLFSLFVATTAFAQGNAKIALKTAAERMNSALVNRNYEVFVKTTYPKALEMTPGGEEKLIATLKSQIASMDKEGSRIVAAWIGEPSTFIDTADELQCTVSQKMALQFESGKLITETTLLAISPDKGTNWYFIDAADRTIEKMRAVFPNLSSKLVLLKSPQPVFESNTSKTPVKTTPLKK